MILENCCYDFFELLTLNMARQGFFGELMHAEGAYIHDLLHANFEKDQYYDMWRLKENFRAVSNTLVLPPCDKVTSTGLLVFHEPEVKSGTSTDFERFATDASLSGAMALHAAAS